MNAYEKARRAEEQAWAKYAEAVNGYDPEDVYADSRLDRRRRRWLAAYRDYQTAETRLTVRLLRR